MTKGMDGFQELAELAVAEVRGIRTWTLALPGCTCKTCRPGQLRGSWGYDWQSQDEAAVCQTLINKEVYWKNQLSMDEGMAAHGEIPHPTCGCGFWAYWKSSQFVLGYTRVPVPRIVTPPPLGSFMGLSGEFETAMHDSAGVAGIIQGYGRIVIGEKGFRAERAKLLALTSGGYHHADQTLANKFRDVAVFDSLTEMLTEFPTSDGGLLEEYKRSREDEMRRRVDLYNRVSTGWLRSGRFPFLP